MLDRYIAYAARQNPFAPAISTLHGDITFARFEAEVALCAAWIDSLRLAPDGLVVVRCADRYLHWLLLLGLARCDIASASISALTPPGVLDALSPQLLLSDVETPADQRTHVGEVRYLSPDLARHILSSEPNFVPRSRRRDAERVLRIATSSGTTGLPKRIALSRSMIERRMPNMLRLAPAAIMRFLPLVGPESGAFEVCLSAWASGGTVILPPPSVGELSEALHLLAPELLAGAPIQLQHLLAARPRAALPLAKLRVSLFGAHSPLSLREEIAQRLTADVSNLLGSTECGLVAAAHAAHLTDPASAGYVFPWVDVEIVDDADQPVAAGETGRMRIRSPDAVDGYLNDPEATRRYFLEGWFYPGDIASLSESGMLRLEGRSDDVINAGGEKLLPLRLEEAARGCAGVVDAAGFMAPGAEGGETAWVAIVKGGRVDKAQLAAQFARLGAPAVNIAWVEQIPRNERGKIQRDQLRQDLTWEQRRRQAGPHAA